MNEKESRKRKLPFMVYDMRYIDDAAILERYADRSIKLITFKNGRYYVGKSTPATKSDLVMLCKTRLELSGYQLTELIKKLNEVDPGDSCHGSEVCRSKRYGKILRLYIRSNENNSFDVVWQEQEEELEEKELDYDSDADTEVGIATQPLEFTIPKEDWNDCFEKLIFRSVDDLQALAERMREFQQKCERVPEKPPPKKRARKKLAVEETSEKVPSYINTLLYYKYSTWRDVSFENMFNDKIVLNELYMRYNTAEKKDFNTNILNHASRDEVLRELEDLYSCVLRRLQE